MKKMFTGLGVFFFLLTGQAQGVWHDEAIILLGTLQGHARHLAVGDISVHALDSQMTVLSQDTQRLMTSVFPDTLLPEAQGVITQLKTTLAQEGLPDYFTPRYHHACTAGYEDVTHRLLQVAGGVIERAGPLGTGHMVTYYYLILSLDPANGSPSALYNSLFVFCVGALEFLRE